LLQGKQRHCFPYDVALQYIVDAVAPEHDHGGGEALGSTPRISRSEQADNMGKQCSFTLWMLSCRGLSMQCLLSISPSKQVDNMGGQCSFTLWMLSCRGLLMQWLLRKTRMWVRP